LRRVDVAIALIYDDAREKILMVRNRSGDSSYWSLPGGAVEPGETLEQAVKRETKEESGFDIEITSLYSVREAFFAEAGHHALLFTFRAYIVSGKMEASDPDDDIMEVKWVDIHTANEILANYPVKMSISSEESAVGYSFHGRV